MPESLDIVLYRDPDSDYSALYVHGLLRAHGKDAIVGAYLNQLFGVNTRHSTDFWVGQDSPDGIAADLDTIDRYVSAPAIDNPNAGLITFLETQRDQINDQINRLKGN